MKKVIGFIPEKKPIKKPDKKPPEKKQAAGVEKNGKSP